MKKLLAVLAVLAVLLLASYYVVGTRVQPVLQETLDKAVANAPQLTITPKSSSQGLFTSRYVYTVDFPLPPEAGKPGPERRITADITYDVTHGPIPVMAGSLKPCLALVDTRFSLDPSADKDVSDFFTKFPELAQTRLLTRVNFDSSLNTRVTVPPFDRTVTSDKGVPTRFAFLGLSGDIAAPATLEQGSGTLVSPGLTIEDAAASVALTDLGITVDSRQLRPSLAVGTYQFRVKSLDITPKGKPSTTLKELAAEAALTPRDKVLDYTVALSTLFNDPTSGFAPARMSFALRNLDIDTLEHVTAMVRENQKNGMQPMTEEQLRKAAGTMLPRDPSISLDITALEGARQLTLHMDAHTEGMTSLPPVLPMALPQLRAKANFSGQEQSIVDFACLLTKEQANTGKEDCPKTLSEGIQNILAQGLAVREGDKLKSEAVWDGQALTVNGKRMQ